MQQCSRGLPLTAGAPQATFSQLLTLRQSSRWFTAVQLQFNHVRVVTKDRDLLKVHFFNEAVMQMVSSTVHE
ncbi:hypothetical protein GCK32_010345 [Trichostrongylus colubriformis]|uniref:Uncharacterized protein n=1 Tax=Trichostrongylus colubriformis TaxID=6319 RepID=A0AAN8FXG2_TRICO